MGGWTSTATQHTIITPNTVRTVLPIVQQFIFEFDDWIRHNTDIFYIEMGPLLGSAAYYEIDKDDIEYGDIDIQMICSSIDGKDERQVAAAINKHLDEFIKTTNPSVIHYEGDTNGHPIFKVGDEFVQVDFVWATNAFADWAQYRMTPEHGVKGAVHGSIFSTLGDMFGASIQASGVQVKYKHGTIVNFARSRNVDSVETISDDIEVFGFDIVNRLYYDMEIDAPLQLSSRLINNAGLRIDNISSEQLIEVVIGIAESFELNDMYGKYVLYYYKDKAAFLDSFQKRYAVKMNDQANSSKFDKALDQEAKKKADATKEKLLAGIDFVKALMD